MAVFNILNNTDWDSYEALAGGTILRHSGRSLLYVSDTGFKITLHGTGFTYDALGIPTGGTITGLEVLKKGVLLAEYTGLSTPLTDFATLALGLTSGVAGTTSPDMPALFAVLRDGDDLINTNDLSKSISGYDGNDTIFANGGDDWMSGGRGVDSYFGGAGLNGVFFDDGEAADHGVSINFALKTGNILDDGFGNTETTIGIEMAEGTVFADSFTGGKGNNAFYGMGGDDTLIGGDGNDSLQGGQGLDAFYGGTGVDTLTFFDVVAGGAGVRVRLLQGSVNDGFGNIEHAEGIENVIGTHNNDTLWGDHWSNVLWGWDGDDILAGDYGSDSLYGEAGSDTIYGGDGDDIIAGDLGRDRYDGGTGSDNLVFWDVDATGHGVTVNLALSTRQVRDDGYGNRETAGNVENLEGSNYGDFFTGNLGSNFLWGHNGRDTLSGNDGSDALFGGAGMDGLIGGAGDDTLEGGKGLDSTNGGSDKDLLAFWHVDATGHGATVNLGLLSQQIIDDGYGNAETAISVEALAGSDYGDRFTASSLDTTIYGNGGNDTLTGGAGNDLLFGDDGNDFLSGGVGDDLLWGGYGDNTLTGGLGADWFIFDPSVALEASDKLYHITDFTPGTDKLAFPTEWLGGRQVGGIYPFQFDSGPGQTPATSHVGAMVIYDTSTGNIYFDPDGGFSRLGYLIAQLDNHPALSSADFFITGTIG